MLRGKRYPSEAAATMLLNRAGAVTMVAGEEAVVEEVVEEVAVVAVKALHLQLLPQCRLKIRTMNSFVDCFPLYDQLLIALKRIVTCSNNNNITARRGSLYRFCFKESNIHLIQAALNQPVLLRKSLEEIKS